MGAFGEKLRKQREQRGIALDAISNTTKISTRMLRAIEEEHFDQLPGGVFNKGFVRAYARQVGLNEEEAVSDYLTALRESQIAAQTVPPNFRAHPGKPSTEPDRRNHEPGRVNAPGHDVFKNGLPKPDLLKNDLLKSDLRKENTQKNDIGRDAGPAESGRNKNNQPIPRLSADRRRKDHREDRRNQDQRNQDRHNKDRHNKDGRNRDRTAENPQARAPLSPNQHPQSDYAEPVVSPAEGPAASVPWGKLAGVLLLLTLTLALWNLHRRGQATLAAQTTPQTAAQSAAQTTSKVAPAPLPSAASASSPGQLSVNVPIKPAASSTPLTAGKALATGTLVTAAAPNSSTAPTLADAASPKPSSAPTSKSPTGKPTAGSPASSDNLPAPQSTVHAAAAKAPPTFSLLIRATETSWVTVIADGQPLLKETLIAPAQTSVRATREIVVHTGNAAGISFLLNGKEIPLSGAEGEGEARTYTFDNAGLKTPTH